MAKLGESQRKVLRDYLLEKKEMILSKNPTSSEVCDWVFEGCKFRVDLNNITRLVGPDGTLFKHVWAGSEAARKGRAGSAARFNILCEQVELLRLDMLRYANELGVAGYGRAHQEWTGVLHVVRSQLADTDFREDEEK